MLKVRCSKCRRHDKVRRPRKGEWVDVECLPCGVLSVVYLAGDGEPRICGYHDPVL